MAVKIGSARIDEHGQAHGGTAGDQTGKEVSTQSWYAHTKGWVLLRAKSAEAREKIARCMQAACDNKHVGYDQYSRESLYNEANGNIKSKDNYARYRAGIVVILWGDYTIRQQ